MFPKPNDATKRTGMDPIYKKHPPTIIAADVNMLGNIISEGVLDIDGKIEGNLKCKCVTIRKNGRIKGDILAEEVHVFGEVQGLIKAREVHLFASCHVEGVIMHEALTIEDGAFVDGQFKRRDRMRPEDEDADDVAGIEVFRNLKLIN